MRLSACIVSYRSGGFALTCARSVLGEWERAGRRRDDLDLVVVDNGADPLAADDDPAWARALDGLGVLVVRSERNRGYAGGVELGFSLAREADHDLILNADLCLLPGSLETLLEAAEARPDAGALAPQCFLDPGCTLALPPVADLTPLSHWRDRLAPHWGSLARREADRRTRAALRWWAGSEPFEAPNLSGACLLIPAGARADLGGRLLDPGFPLYFEDNDLCRRLVRAGRELWAVPGARIVHHWARSSGVGTAREAEAAARHRVSRELWLERWYGRAGARLAAAADGLAELRTERPRTLHTFTDLGELHGRLDFELPPGAGPWLLELSMTPHFALAAGALGEGRSVTLEPACFEWLFPGEVWGRVLSQDELEPLAAFRFTKREAARTEALELGALRRENEEAA